MPYKNGVILTVLLQTMQEVFLELQKTWKLLLLHKQNLMARRFPRQLFRIALVSVFLVWVSRWCWRQEEIGIRPPQTEAYIQQYGALAVQLGKESGVPAPIILAAGGLESGWGSSELARRGNNHFGIKVDNSNQPARCMPTREFYRRRFHTVDACFRAYPNAADSFRDYCRKLRSDQRYQNLFRHGSRDYKSWAQGLQECGYATDPEYADKLIKLVKLYRLNEVEM